MNFEYMSVTKDKNILNIENNNYKNNINDDNDSFNKTILEIEFEKPIFKNWYLSFKSIDTENISQYPIEKEVIIQPYSIFEIREVKNISSDNLYIKLYLRSNLLSKLSEYDNIPKSILQNLGIINNIGENILESYPNIDLEKIISITFKKQEDLLKNMENIGRMKNIRVLDMTNINLVDNNIKDLIPYLKNLYFLNYLNLSLNNLSYLSLEYLSKIFSSFQFIEHIILDQNSFGNDGIIALSQGLKSIENANIKSLSAFYNQIKSDGIDKLSEELKHYKNLNYLNLSTNYIFYEEMDDLVNSIKFLNNLIELNLSNNQISSEGISNIGQILPKTIQKLNFSENEIYQDGFSDFGYYLNRMPNLNTLIIYGNRNGPSGVNALLDGLEYCTYLSYLDFGCTRIEDCDIVLILKKIRKIKNIKYFNIKENNLTDDSIYFLIQCINILTKLETLDISWNALEGANLQELFGILVKLNKFKCVNIEGNPCENEKKDINNLLDILNQGNKNNKVWNFQKGKFFKNENVKTEEIFINKYISEVQNQ
jgi:Ran GTPase-activating protein (RanGAP) involved in mRNA processing and transport